MDKVTIDAARHAAFSAPLDQIDVSNPKLFQDDTIGHYFERLRRDDPVHFSRSPVFGDYWSVTRYNDIMDIETNHSVFSSAASLGGITIRDVPADFRRESFIAMDQPRHSAQRKTVAPMFTPTHLDQLAINIRKRSAECLDNLPRNEVFDWVDRVSVELTTQMLATLFDFPFEDRRLLTWWSDMATGDPDGADPAGFDPDDVETIVTMVQYHLLIPDVATRRDLDDPATVAGIARQVGSIERLELLGALTEADSLATGPAAWSAWKEQLVRDLHRAFETPGGARRLVRALGISRSVWRPR